MHDARYMALVEALGGFAGWLANATKGVVTHAKNSTAVAHWCQ